MDLSNLAGAVFNEICEYLPIKPDLVSLLQVNKLIRHRALRSSRFGRLSVFTDPLPWHDLSNVLDGYGALNKDGLIELDLGSQEVKPSQLRQILSQFPNLRKLRVNLDSRVPTPTFFNDTLRKEGFSKELPKLSLRALNVEASPVLSSFVRDIIRASPELVVLIAPNLSLSIVPPEAFLMNPMLQFVDIGQRNPDHPDLTAEGFVDVLPQHPSLKIVYALGRGNEHPSMVVDDLAKRIADWDVAKTQIRSSPKQLGLFLSRMLLNSEEAERVSLTILMDLIEMGISWKGEQTPITNQNDVPFNEDEPWIVQYPRPQRMSYLSPYPPPLFAALYQHRFDMCDIMLQHGADINQKDANGDGALHLFMSAEFLHLDSIPNDIFDYYINHGGDLHYSNKQGHTLLTDAIRTNLHKTAEQLLSAMNNNLTSDLLLFLLSSPNSRNDLVTSCLESNKCDLGAKDKEGRTALILAVGFDHHRTIVEPILMGNVGVVNERDEQGRTALYHLAIRRDASLSMMKLLLENGADPNIADNDGVTCLMLNQCPLLLEFGANPNAQSKEGWTPLLAQCAFSDVDGLEAILSKGVNIDAADVNGITPLMMSIMTTTNCELMVNILLDHGADVNLTNIHGMTALHLASVYAPQIISKLVTAHGADVNARNCQGRTPLHYAMKVNNQDAIAALLDLNADVNAQDMAGVTPIMDVMRFQLSALSVCQCSTRSPRYPFVLCCALNDNFPKRRDFSSQMYAMPSPKKDLLVPIIKMVMSQPIDATIVDNRGQSLFHCLPVPGDDVLGNFFLHLLEGGLNINAYRNGMLPLQHLIPPMSAASPYAIPDSNGGMDWLDWIASHPEFTSKIDLSLIDSQGRTMLHHLASEELSHLLPLFLSGKWMKQPDLSQCDRQGNTVLHCLAFQPRTDSRDGSIRLLISHGADPNVLNAEGNAFIHSLMSSSAGLSSKPIFFDFPGVNINIQNNITGMTPLMQCVLNSMNKSNSTIHTRYLLPTDSDNIGIMTLQKFLDHPDIDLSIKDFRGKTAGEYGLDLLRPHLRIFKNRKPHVKEDEYGRLPVHSRPSGPYGVIPPANNHYRHPGLPYHSGLPPPLPLPAYMPPMGRGMPASQLPNLAWPIQRQK
eukprot:TRINITY_DN4210_c0_g1_i3.p1 TRINITY_DN4210_c0_g1~~TRINITY_DN4210_c0_g1_i3.p1  ORF type:complete len:1120 (+),score=266.32 TRINITY_DN4210_c0_g1_i3:3-3362(+)